MVSLFSTGKATCHGSSPTHFRETTEGQRILSRASISQEAQAAHPLKKNLSRNPRCVRPRWPRRNCRESSWSKVLADLLPSDPPRNRPPLLRRPHTAFRASRSDTTPTTTRRVPESGAGAGCGLGSAQLTWCGHRVVLTTSTPGHQLRKPSTVRRTGLLLPPPPPPHPSHRHHHHHPPPAHTRRPRTIDTVASGSAVETDI